MSEGLSRRSFLTAAGTAAAGFALATAGGALASPSRSKTGVVTPDKLGIQLWTCLGAYAASTPTTFEAIASIGYKYVEYAFGYGSFTDPKAYRKALDDAGLWCLGGHDRSPYPWDANAWKQYVENSMIVGVKNLGHNTTFPTTYSETMRYIDAVHKGHEVARSMGFKGYIYNHMEAAQWNKLTDRPGTYAVELVMQHTSKSVYNGELDTAHALAPLGTLDAVNRMIRKHPHRWPLYHMKDGVGPVAMADGSYPALPVNATPFGIGDFGRPDLNDPSNRPHAGFQDMLTAVRETQDWKDVYLMAETDGSQATCVDYAKPCYDGLKGLKFSYRG